jgi:hypothetical protein
MRSKGISPVLTRLTHGKEECPRKFVILLGEIRTICLISRYTKGKRGRIVEDLKEKKGIWSDSMTAKAQNEKREGGRKEYENCN